MSATGIPPLAAGARAAQAPPLSVRMEPERIAVFRALQLGDLLCAVPALRALRAAYPRAHVTLVGLPWAEAFVRRFPQYLDGFLAFPGGAGLPERSASADEANLFFRQACAARFDLALQLHGSGRYSNGIVARLGARECAGFYARGDACPDPERFIAYPSEEPEIRRLLRLLESLGIPPRGEELEFPIAGAEWRAAAQLRARFGLVPGRYVCLHPGARAPARRWAARRFAHVADRLAARGLRVVLSGTAEEAELAHDIARAMLAPCFNLAGDSPLPVLAPLLTGARLLVCNDTGVSHIAAALKVPSVVVYTGSSPEWWAPLDRELHRRVLHPIGCRPCQHVTCPIGHKCAEDISVEDVMREVDGLLGCG